MNCNFRITKQRTVYSCLKIRIFHLRPSKHSERSNNISRGLGPRFGFTQTLFPSVRRKSRFPQRFRGIYRKESISHEPSTYRLEAISLPKNRWGAGAVVGRVYGSNVTSHFWGKFWFLVDLFFPPFINFSPGFRRVLLLFNGFVSFQVNLFCPN